VEIRLAYERGFLTQKSLNPVQEWALVYWVYMTDRMKMEENDAFLERQTLNLNYEAWTRLYRDRIMRQLGVDESGEPEIEVTPDDLDELDRFMAQQEADFSSSLAGKHSMGGGARAFDFTAQAEPLAWGDWV
jgi:hypothetical protein